ncbi:MAG: hypothetical protein M1290_05200 [Candidatus Thermoplasmatota archaeon]|jgi:hypothetical protein|nr:hypothetical protein [Candidatus Thermoplasmatota archaeon]MCL5789841.1 hypothetical protein [Candidatus Thermoplasmatota archaeon]
MKKILAVFSILAAVIMVLTIFSGATAVTPMAGQNDPQQHSLYYYNNELNVMFESWTQANNINTSYLTNASVKQLFASFLNVTPAAGPIMINITAIERNNSVQKTSEIIMNFMNGRNDLGNLISSTTKSVVACGDNYTYNYSRYSDSVNGSNWNILKITVYSANGSLVIDPYVFCTVTYLKVDILGLWVTYGEDDYYNVIYTGSDAQTFYNNFENSWNWGTGGIGILIGFLLGISIPTLGVSDLAAAIIGAVVAAIMLGLTVTVGNALTTVYESTYANGPNPNAPPILQGQKYIWLYLDNEYIYPWTTVISLASSIGFYGHLATPGSIETLWPNVPYVLTSGFTGVAISGYFSAGIQDFISSYGQNNWVWFS